MKINLGEMGVITGDKKRLMEGIFFDKPGFVQRKNYDEYCVANAEFECDVTFNDLMQLSFDFTVKLSGDHVVIKES